VIVVSVLHEIYQLQDRHSRGSYQRRNKCERLGWEINTHGDSDIPTAAGITTREKQRYVTIDGYSRYLLCST